MTTSEILSATTGFMALAVTLHLAYKDRTDKRTDKIEEKNDENLVKAITAIGAKLDKKSIEMDDFSRKLVQIEANFNNACDTTKNQSKELKESIEKVTTALSELGLQRASEIAAFQVQIKRLEKDVDELQKDMKGIA